MVGFLWSEETAITVWKKSLPTFITVSHLKWNLDFAGYKCSSLMNEYTDYD